MAAKAERGSDFSYKQRLKSLLLEDTVILEPASIQPQV